jgi:hypothetical protein
MATALAKIFEDDYYTETLVICPKNLTSMWEYYARHYHLHAKVLSLSKIIDELPEKTKRYGLVIIDESHNLRNKESKRWKVMRDYIERSESLTILLTATPYNKTNLDLAAQLGLFLNEDTDIGIKPEHLLNRLGGESEFARHYQCGIRTLAAFTKSNEPDDWRDIMRFYMVRRTRGFIIQNYAKSDERGKYLLFPDGRKSYFPKRVPKNLTFKIDESNPNDPYARFYSKTVVNTINQLRLPRYGLGNYLIKKQKPSHTSYQAKIIEGLSRAGTRLMGFCRINLFKRLESAGPAFILSTERHILRNFIVLHAIENGLEIPIGTQGAEFLDTRYYDEDPESVLAENDDGDPQVDTTISNGLSTETSYRARAAQAYAALSGPLKTRFRWLPSTFFTKNLAKDLIIDAQLLMTVLDTCGQWHAQADNKLAALVELVKHKHAKDKLLVFTQFADTARYLKSQLVEHGVTQIAEATGQSDDPAAIAWRFSPQSSGKQEYAKETGELRVLIATDVLSEGQNLQDAHIIVNYDLPWAIIRLIQRAGRVDRIGQRSNTIFCYSFLPTDGIEQLIQLRARVNERLNANAKVVGTDEIFFDDEKGSENFIQDLYTEKNGILDDDADTEVDLASYAYQIWKNATDASPGLATTIESLPNVVYATKAHTPTPAFPNGVLVYLRTSQGNDALAWIDNFGKPVTQSQLTILKAAACSVETPAMPKTEQHHELTLRGMEYIIEEEKLIGGALGRSSDARSKTYQRLKQFRQMQGNNRDFFITDDIINRIDKTLEEIYSYPLYQSAADTLGRRIKAGINDSQLIELVLSLREDQRLCIADAQQQQNQPHLICSLGLA